MFLHIVGYTRGEEKTKVDQTVNENTLLFEHYLCTCFLTSAAVACFWKGLWGKVQEAKCTGSFEIVNCMFSFQVFVVLFYFYLFCFSLQGLFFIALLSCRKKKRFPGSVVSLNPRIFWPGFGIEQQTGSFCKAASRPALGINIDQHTCIPRTAEIWWHRLVSRIAIEYHHQHNYTVKWGALCMLPLSCPRHKISLLSEWMFFFSFVPQILTVLGLCK